MNRLRPLLVLDLDECLIRSSDCYLGFKEDFLYPTEYSDSGHYWVYKRPYLDEFFKHIKEYYDLAIWSSGTLDYVNYIVSKIKPDDIEFEFIYARDKCTLKRDMTYNHYIYEKRLKKLKSLGYSLERMLIVDDSPEKCRDNYGNAIIVSEWLGNEGDNELESLLFYLIKIADTSNFRKLDKRNWKYDVNE